MSGIPAPPLCPSISPAWDTRIALTRGAGSALQAHPGKILLLLGSSAHSQVMAWITFGVQQTSHSSFPPALWLPGVTAPCQHLQGWLLAKDRHLPAGFMASCQGLWGLLISIY